MINFSRPHGYIDHPLARGGVVTQARDGLGEAYRAEKDKDVAGRILAVHYVLDRGMTHGEAAEMVFCSASSVDNWVARYREGGVDALRDLPRPGRPRLVGRGRLGKIMDVASRPHAKARAMRKAIYERTGTLYHITTVRLRMREHGLSPKRAHPVHVNRASDREVSRWQRVTEKRIRDLERRGFTAVAQDEAMVRHDSGGGGWLWTGRGERAHVQYTGSHRKVVLYGGIAGDGRRLCQVRKKFDAATFVAYLRKLHQKFGKVAVVLDRASQHRAEEVADYLKGCGGEVVLVYLPVGTPELNVVEGLWLQLRRILLGMLLPGFDEFRRAVSDILRTMPHSLDMFAYMGRTVKRDKALPCR